MSNTNPISNETTTPIETINYRSGAINKIGFIFKVGRKISQLEQVSLLVQFTEILFLYLTRRLGPLLYYEARLWRRELSVRYKMGFMNDAQYRKRVEQLNPPAYQSCSQNKLVEKSILTLLGVPTPTFIGYLHPVIGCTPLSEPLRNPSDLENVLRKQHCQKICFKLTAGWGGNGFIAAEVRDRNNTIFLKNALAKEEEEVEVSVFFNKYVEDNFAEGYVIEQYIEQHQFLENMNQSSLNTLRIWLIEKEERVQMIGAILRVGRKDQVIDNTSQGGILSVIDCQTGILGIAKTGSIVPVHYSSHPDSGAVIEGAQLPYWPECVALAKHTLKVFPHARFTGLDMAITPTGPMIIELNLTPDRVTARNFSTPLIDLLS